MPPSNLLSKFRPGSSRSREDEYAAYYGQQQQHHPQQHQYYGNAYDGGAGPSNGAYGGHTGMSTSNSNSSGSGALHVRSSYVPAAGGIGASPRSPSWTGPGAGGSLPSSPAPPFYDAGSSSGGGRVAGNGMNSPVLGRLDAGSGVETWNSDVHYIGREQGPSGSSSTGHSGGGGGGASPSHSNTPIINRLGLSTFLPSRNGASASPKADKPTLKSLKSFESLTSRKKKAQQREQEQLLEQQRFFNQVQYAESTLGAGMLDAGPSSAASSSLNAPSPSSIHPPRSASSNSARYYPPSASSNTYDPWSGTSSPGKRPGSSRSTATADSGGAGGRSVRERTSSGLRNFVTAATDAANAAGSAVGAVAQRARRSSFDRGRRPSFDQGSIRSSRGADDNGSIRSGMSSSGPRIRKISFDRGSLRGGRRPSVDMISAPIPLDAPLPSNASSTS